MLQSLNIRNVVHEIYDIFVSDVFDCKKKEKKEKKKYLTMPQHGDKRNLECIMHYMEYYH